MLFKTKSNFSFIELYKIRKNFIRVVSKFRNLEKIIPESLLLI